MKSNSTTEEVLQLLSTGCRSGKNAGRFQSALDYARKSYELDVAHYEEKVRSIEFSNGRVLDLGSGAGRWSLGFAHNNSMVVGLDINDEYTQISRIFSSNLDNGDRCFFITAGAEDIPYPDNYFDYMFTSGVLMFTDLDRSISEVLRVLRPGGRAYFRNSSLGWYLMYFLQDGLLGGNSQGRFGKGLSVLTDTFRMDLGFRAPTASWFAFSPERFHDLLVSKGFNVLGRPGIFDNKPIEFVGVTAQYDFLAEKSHETKPAPTAVEQIEACIDVWDLRSALDGICIRAEANLDDDVMALTARVMLKSGKPDVAAKLLKSIPVPDERVGLYLGMCEHAQGNFQQAFNYYNSVDQGVPGKDLEFLKAECLRQANNLQPAADIYQSLIGRHPEDFAYHVGYMACQAVMGNNAMTGQAIASFLDQRASLGVDPMEIAELRSKLG